MQNNNLCHNCYHLIILFSYFHVVQHNRTREYGIHKRKETNTLLLKFETLLNQVFSYVALNKSLSEKKDIKDFSIYFKFEKRRNSSNWIIFRRI
ncbi:hypothetical protein BpHYR1_037812 [Brachionus plicatilis]|uniref:Uncharacterized protein n=1 Tax=Brachionus plicatilis TaxID=10195 RepID=A0A3M7QKB9_BRAPC|nr:hypothetical protein BpHYR1_037812 [Brachionus plicatilis]